MLVDSHAHLFWPKLVENLEEVIRRAKKAGVEKIIVPGLEVKSNRQSINIAKRFPGVVYASVGLHPEFLRTKSNWQKEVEQIDRLIQKNREVVVAVGEVGLDRYWSDLKEKEEAQKKMFIAMIKLSEKYDLPLIIHSRQAEEMVWQTVRKRVKIRGVLHAFEGNQDIVREINNHKQWWIGCGGKITWSKKVMKLGQEIYLEKFMIETDSPFMLPQELRGRQKINEPANARIIAQKIAKIKGVKLETIEQATSKNVKKLFGI